ncbi:MAG: hypothetical protein ACFFED_08950, partial [Candidatus Thorarchaeota archaeon]
KKEDAEVIYSRYTLEEMGNLYFSILQDTVETSMVNVLGHLDLYRRYGEDSYGRPIFDLWKPHIDDLAKKMLKYNVGFEVNTSSWRKGQVEPHPSKDLIQSLVSRGIDTITVGSDAHSPQMIGDGIDNAITLLRDCCNLVPSTFRRGKAYSKFDDMAPER